MTILIIITMSSAFAIESSVSPHTGTGQNILLSFWDTGGPDILRVYLLPCEITDSGIDCEDIRESMRIIEANISGDGSFSIDISGEERLYRICVKLKESGNQDCDKDNYYMLYNEGCVTYQVVEQVVEQIIDISDEISVDLVSVPSILFANTSFISCANISNTGDVKNVTAYSYLYNGSKCISGTWLANSRELTLSENFTYLCFENNVDEDAEPDEYKFKVRVNWNDTKYDSQPFTIHVQKQETLELNVIDVVEENSSLLLTFENSGNLPANLTIVLDSDSWVLNETLYLPENSTEDISLEISPYNFKMSVYVMSGDIIFYSRVFYKDKTSNEAVYLKGGALSGFDGTEERYLYPLLSVFTLIVLAVLIWSFVRK